MAISYVHGANAYASGGTTFSFTMPVNPTTGNLLFVTVSFPNSGITIAVSDDKGNTYTKIANTSASFCSSFAWYAANITGGTLTITLTSSGSIVWPVSVAEFSGVDATSPLIGFATGTNTSSGASVDISSAALSAGGSAGDLIVAAGGDYYLPTWAAGATNPPGMAIITDATSDHATGTGNTTIEYAVLTSSYSGAVSINPHATTYGQIIAAAFKAAGSGGGGTTYTETLTETYSLAEIVLRQTGKAINDSTGLAERLSRATNKNTDDLLSLSETLVRLPGKALNESLSISDLFSKAKANLLALLDAINPADAISRATSRVLSEAYSLFDVLAKARPKAFYDAVTLVDSLARSTGKVMQDSISIAESVTRAIGRTLSESAIALSDGFSIAKSKLLILLDSIGLADVISRTIGKLAIEAIAISESVTRGINKTFADSVSLFDVVSRTKAKLIALLDALSLNDTLHKSTEKAYSEVISMADWITRQTGRILGELFTLGDSLSASGGKLLNLIESVVLSDQLTKGTAQAYTEVVVLLDVIKRNLGRAFQESVRLVESFLSAITGVNDAVRSFLAEVLQRLWAVQRTGGNTMIFTAKDKDSDEDFAIDWSGTLEDDSIQSSTWTVPSGITLVQESNTTTTATARLSGGSVGKQYICENAVTLVSGQVKVQRIRISVTSS